MMASGASAVGASGGASPSSRFRFQAEIQSMCYTCGDVRSTHTATAELVEDVVRQQVVELAVEAAAVAQRRGSRFLSMDDVMFALRHDAAKTTRITDFLSWKEVRKNAKQASSNTGDDADAVVDGEDDRQQRRKRVRLGHDFVQSLTDGLIRDEDLEEDEETSAMHHADMAQRLREADEMTRDMSREEYMEFAECRQASFTYKKMKRFRDWLNLGAYTELKPNDDILEILGYVAWEIVGRLVRTALIVKAEWETFQPDQQKKTRFTEREKLNRGLFVIPNERTPVLPEHVREAYRRMQLRDRPLELFAGVRAHERTHVD